MTSVLRYGMIGCGMMGIEHIRNIALLPDTEIAAIHEPDPVMRRQASLLAPGCVMADSVETLLREPLDAIVIASPNHCHADQIARILDRQPVPMLVEKPVCTTLDQVTALSGLAREVTSPIWVGMEYRYMPPLARLIARAHSATGGVRMLSIREHRYPFLQKVGNWNRLNRYSGGTLVEKCCHFFDLMCVVTGMTPVRVYASAAQDVNHLDESINGERSDILDNAYVTVDFASGTRAMLDLCMFAEGAAYQEEIAVTGPSGRIEAFIPGPTRFWDAAELGPQPVPKLVTSPRSPKGPVTEEIPVDPELLAAGDHNGSTFYQHRQFRAVLTGSGSVEVSLADGLRAVVMGLAAQHSAATGEAVDLTTGPWRLPQRHTAPGTQNG